MTLDRTTSKRLKLLVLTRRGWAGAMLVACTAPTTSLGRRWSHCLTQAALSLPMLTMAGTLCWWWGACCRAVVLALVGVKDCMYVCVCVCVRACSCAYACERVRVRLRVWVGFFSHACRQCLFSLVNYLSCIHIVSALFSFTSTLLHSLSLPATVQL